MAMSGDCREMNWLTATPSALNDSAAST